MITLAGTALTLSSLLLSTSGRSQEAPSHSSETSSPPSAHLFALSLAYQAPLSLDKSFPLGGGLMYTREYFVSARTALGIHGGIRLFPTSPRHIALGYGLTIKHYLGLGESAGPGSGAYLLYGLLLQMNFLQGRAGSATGHDTRLAAGYDWKTELLFPFVELGYHITQVRSFDEETLWWPYTEILWGLRF